jgi:Ca2+/H+ antiporter, TMEM165/GDT1 family
MDLQTVATTFALVLVMELGDKTLLVVLGLAARGHRPLPLFAGAVAGLAAVTLLAVTAGTLALSLLPAIWLRRAAALLFLAIGLVAMASALRRRKPEEGGLADAPPRSPSALGTAAVVALLLFAAEMGDKTQLAVIGLTAQTGAPASVFAGALAALALVTLAAAWLGRRAARIVPARWISLAGGLAFVGIGGWILAGGW